MKTLQDVPQDSYNTIELGLNVDGIPIYKSKHNSVWPIQCAIENVNVAKDPFIVGMFYGKGKPCDTEFLKDFVEELKVLKDCGINGKAVLLKNVICDAPARALLKGTTQYNGRYGCDFCNVKGQFDGRMTFLYKGNDRTDSSFREKLNLEHHKSDSIFLSLDLDMIRQFPPEPMHCIDLGVTKRLLVLWKEGPVPLKLSSNMINLISNYNECFKQNFPSNFNRKPRRLDELHMWKATEYRTFLMYTGPIILRYILPKEQYIHFLTLAVAVRIMYNQYLISHHKRYCEELLSYFIDKSQELYTQKFVTYNVHLLHHVADAALQYGSLENCSAYKFENNLSKVKNLVLGTGNPLVEIGNRLREKEHFGATFQKKTPSQSIEKNSFHQLANGKFVMVHENNKTTGKVLCEVYRTTEPFFIEPWDSRFVGIHKVKTENSEMARIDVCQLETPVVGIPLSLFDKDHGSYKYNILITLIHTE